MITMMITKDDDKGDGEKLKDQSRTIQEFKIRIKKKVQRQESRFKVQDLKNQDQDSRLKIQG